VGLCWSELDEIPLEWDFADPDLVAVFPLEWDFADPDLVAELPLEWYFAHKWSTRAYRLQLNIVKTYPIS
jgi:hypothetical protein